MEASATARRDSPSVERGIALSRTKQHGAIAQLGERVLCKHEVVGSIPSGSTIHFVHGVASRHYDLFVLDPSDLRANGWAPPPIRQLLI